MRSRLLAALFSLTVLLAACGGGSAPQTREGFISAADGVCQKLFGEIAQAGSADPKTPEQIAEANTVLANLYERLSRDLADVPLPEEGAARRGAEAFVASVRRADPLLVRMRAAARRFEVAARAGDAQAAATAGNDVRSALDAFRAARAESDRLAVDYGLNFCGNLG